MPIAILSAPLRAGCHDYTERTDEQGIARAAQTGPVFSIDPASGDLHMRYTARTRSIEWKQDATTGGCAMLKYCWRPIRRISTTRALTAAWACCATTCCMTVLLLLTMELPRACYFGYAI